MHTSGKTWHLHLNQSFAVKIGSTEKEDFQKHDILFGCSGAGCTPPPVSTSVLCGAWGIPSDELAGCEWGGTLKYWKKKFSVLCTLGNKRSRSKLSCISWAISCSFYKYLLWARIGGFPNICSDTCLIYVPTDSSQVQVWVSLWESSPLVVKVSPSRSQEIMNFVGKLYKIFTLLCSRRKIKHKVHIARWF